MIATVADALFLFKTILEGTIIGIPLVIIINLMTAGALLYILHPHKPHELFLFCIVFAIECIPILEVFPTWVALVLALKAGGRI
jgi:hypothetical protein